MPTYLDGSGLHHKRTALGHAPQRRETSVRAIVDSAAHVD